MTSENVERLRRELAEAEAAEARGGNFPPTGPLDPDAGDPAATAPTTTTDVGAGPPDYAAERAAAGEPVGHGEYPPDAAPAAQVAPGPGSPTPAGAGSQVSVPGSSEYWRGDPAADDEPRERSVLERLAEDFDAGRIDARFALRGLLYAQAGHDELVYADENPENAT